MKTTLGALYTEAIRNIQHLIKNEYEPESGLNEKLYDAIKDIGVCSFGETKWKQQINYLPDPQVDGSLFDNLKTELAKIEYVCAELESDPDSLYYEWVTEHRTMVNNALEAIPDIEDGQKSDIK